MASALPNIPSPCVGICTMDAETNLCSGCFRTLEEIGAWGSASNQQRYEIVQDLKQRRIAAGRFSESDLRPRRRRRSQGS